MKSFYFIAILALCFFGCAKRPKAEVYPKARCSFGDTVCTTPPIDTVKKEMILTHVRPWVHIEKGVPPPVTVFYGVNVDTVVNKAPLFLVARYLKKNTSASVVMEGYADTTGSSLYNLNLSMHRAMKVRNILESLGVNQELWYGGRGELPGELSKSRKVVISIHP